MAEPVVIVISGINGAGKTTAARSLLADELAMATFVNADAIAAGLNAFAPEQSAIAAGRIMWRRLHDLVAQKVDFSFETTLSGKAYRPFLIEARNPGYRIRLHYFWLWTVDLASARIRIRVAQGGHSIDDETVRRRYTSSLHNFWNLYRTTADAWCAYDNSEPGAIIMAEGHGQITVNVHDTVRRRKFVEAAEHA